MALPQPRILVILSEVGSVVHDRSRAVERSLPAPRPVWADTPVRQRVNHHEPRGTSAGVPRFLRAPCARGGRCRRTKLPRVARAPSPANIWPFTSPYPCHLERSGIGRSRPIPRSRKIPTAPRPVWADTPVRQRVNHHEPRGTSAGVPRFLRALCARGGRCSRIKLHDRSDWCPRFAPRILNCFFHDPWFRGANQGATPVGYETNPTFAKERPTPTTNVGRTLLSVNV